MNLKRITIFLILPLLLLITPCLGAPEEYAAKVNGEIIPMERYTRAIEATKNDLLEQRKELSTLETSSSLEAQEENSIKSAVLHQLIDSVLIEQGLKKEGIVITEENIKEKIEELKKGFPSSQDFHRSVAEQNMTIEDLKINIKRQLSVDKTKEKLKRNIIVLDEEIKEFYNRNIDIFVQKEKVRIRVILVPSKEAAEAVLGRIAIGEDFAMIAIDASIDPLTKGLGGDMGFIERDEIDGALAEMAFILKPGHVSPVIETDDGFYIIKVEDRIPEKQTTISKARKSIERFLLDEKSATAFQKWLDEQRFDADIEINDNLKYLY